MAKTQIELKEWFILAFLSLVWGSSFILIKKSLVGFNFFEMGLMRSVVAFLTFLPFVFYFAKKITWNRWKEYTLIGLTGSAIPAFLYAIAQTEISSIASGLLNSLTPMFTVIFGLLFFKAKSNLSQILGVSFGLIGAIIIILYGSELEIGSNPYYALFVVVGTMCYAMNANFIKHLFQEEEPIVLGAVSFLFIGVPFFLIAIYIGIPTKVMNEPTAQLSLLYVSILSVMSTVVSLILYYQLIQRTTPLFASSVTYLIPVVVLFWGVIDGESLVVFHFIGLVLIISGVYLVRKG
jgi:drug/metabolite transporter (DMT)-like permease